MTDYATTTPHASPTILDVRLYWRASAYLLAAAAVAGALLNAITGEVVGIPNVLMFDWAHNGLHAVLAAASFTFGYAALKPAIVRGAAITFGIIYGGLGVLGLILGLEAELFGLIGIELGENLLHVGLGAWAIASAVASR